MIGEKTIKEICWNILKNMCDDCIFRNGLETFVFTNPSKYALCIDVFQYVIPLEYEIEYELPDFRGTVIKIMKSEWVKNNISGRVENNKTLVFSRNIMLIEDD